MKLTMFVRNKREKMETIEALEKDVKGMTEKISELDQRVDQLTKEFKNLPSHTNNYLPYIAVLISMIILLHQLLTSVS